jgi:choline dehydrogenase-like flavoprotein
MTLRVAIDVLGRLLFRLPFRRRRELERRNRERSADPTRWFTREERDLVAILVSLLVPTDESSPGASDLGTLGPSAVDRIDAWVAASAHERDVYARGLLVLDEMARKDSGGHFVELSEERQLDLLRLIDKGGQGSERGSDIRSRIRRVTLNLYRMWDGSGAATEFFPLLRRDVLAAFYTSEISWRWLGYDGPPMPDGYHDPTRPHSPKADPDRHAIQIAVDSGRGGAPVRLTANENQAFDVVVIGSGAGGAVVAKELGEVGLSVLVLEAGRHYDPRVDYQTNRTDFEVAARTFTPDPHRDAYTTGGVPFHYNRVKGVGGSTLKYVAMSPRFHESDFRVHSDDGVAADWPLAYADLEPYYARVENELGVSGPTGLDANPFDSPRRTPFPTPPHPFNLASRAVQRGARKLGLHFVREPLAIPSAEWNGRPACVRAGTCTLGCQISAKSSMDVTYLPKAQATGRVTIRSESTASQILVGRDGKARGVLYYDREARTQRVRARAVVVAGNAVETPRLLLLSSCSAFPQGVANSSGLVGKHLTEHLAIFARGLFPDRMDQWRGTPTGGMIQDYYATNRANGFARGWTIVVTTVTPWPFSTAVRTLGWGAEHKDLVRSALAHSVYVGSIGEQLPDLENTVTLDPSVKDCFGLPVPRIVNDARENDRKMLPAICRSLWSILDATGATSVVVDDYVPGNSSHYLGTCRMGSTPQNSVVNAWCRTHDIPNLFIADGSVFVTGAAVNPALTISALATRTAEGIAEAFRRGDL